MISLNLQNLIIPPVKNRVLCWFSCGAASFVATQIAIQIWKETNEIHILYTDTGSEHEDNKRFLNEAEAYFGIPIKILKNKNYKDVFDVIEKTKYINGAYGARCTLELKKKLREDYYKRGDINIFGYTEEEENRINRFKAQNKWYPIYCPLAELGISHRETKAILLKTGIALPIMYQLGYKNNNCIGCVKGGMGYWNKIREDFPDVFERMAQLERRIGRSAIKDTWLDTLKRGSGRYIEENIRCGLLCQSLLDD